MDPNTTASRFGLGSLSEDELYGSECLNEFDAEDLLGHDIDFDDQDDWRAIDL
jgi:hypothetical protein